MLRAHHGWKILFDAQEGKKRHNVAGMTNDHLLSDGKLKSRTCPKNDILKNGRSCNLKERK